MKEMTWKSRLNRLFAHRFALPVLCWCAVLVFWLVQGAVAFAGDSSAKAKGTLTETSIPIESWQLAELTWGEPGENSAPQGQLITIGGDPQMILEDVSGRVVRTVSYNVEFDGDSREMCLYYTTKMGEPYSQDRRVFPKVLADGTYVYTLPRTQIVALRLDPCSPDENKTVGLTFTPQSITLNAASTLPGGADYFIPTWYQLFGLIVYPALAAAALDWLWAVGRQLVFPAMVATGTDRIFANLFWMGGDDLEEMKSGLSSQKGITMLRILNDTTKKHWTKICLVLFGAPAGIRIPDTLIKRAHRAEHSDFRSFEFSLFLCKAS